MKDRSQSCCNHADDPYRGSGALAQILAFARQKMTPASLGDGGTFLMVAGIGFVQERTRWELRRAV